MRQLKGFARSVAVIAGGRPKGVKSSDTCTADASISLAINGICSSGRLRVTSSRPSRSVTQLAQRVAEELHSASGRGRLQTRVEHKTRQHLAVVSSSQQ